MFWIYIKNVIILGMECGCEWNSSNLQTSGYENGLTGLWNLVKSMILADMPMKIGEIFFRTFVLFFELFWEVFPQLFPKWFDTDVRNILNKMGSLKIYFGGFENE